MQAYRDALSGRSTSFVLTPDSGFFRFFENLDGTAAKPTPPGATAGSR
jgi:membrane protease subunit HflC